MTDLAGPALLVATIVGCEVVGFLGGLLTRPSLPGWYAALRKPSWNPPNAVFAPVWTLLFAGMGVALYEALVAPPSATRTWALVLFAAQMALNLSWSALFFAMRSPGWALVEIAGLWAAVAATMVLMFELSALAGWLFVPYLLWVSFAAVLNHAIWVRNR